MRGFARWISGFVLAAITLAGPGESAPPNQEGSTAEAALSEQSEAVPGRGSRIAIKLPARPPVTLYYEELGDGPPVLLLHGLGESIFTEADNLEDLRAHVRAAVRCHFDDGVAPRIIHSFIHVPGLPSLLMCVH